MAKIITDAQILGQKAIALIETWILDMGFTWHPSNTAVEAGIDGWVEMRDPVTGEVSNEWLPFQSRARSKIDETTESVTYHCTQKDLEYWLGGTTPVILVYSRPSTKDAWWVSVKDYFRSRDSANDRKIVFDKARDRFDSEAASRLRQVLISCGSSTYFTPARVDETLISNLFRIDGWPEHIYFAPTTFVSEREINDELKLKVEWPEREWLLYEGKLFSFHNLATEPWNLVCDATSIDRISSTDWSASSNWDDRRLFARMLNQCLRSITGRLRMRHSKEQSCYYFKADVEGKSRKETYRGRTRKTGRDVVQVFAPEGSDNKYYRHNAFSHQFKRFDGNWFLEIEPTYVFTTDGMTPDPKAPEKLAKIKGMEGDAAVAGTILMFADLFRDKTTLFRKKYSFLNIGPIETAVVSASIDDEFWSEFKRPKPPSEASSESAFGEGLFQ